jgi:deoxyribodipyrimidine photo-lyase
MAIPIAIFWHRRDLRSNDNAGLFHALSGEHPVLPLFIFDSDILDVLPSRRDARVHFIREALQQLDEGYAQHGSGLLVLHGKPLEIWRHLLDTYPVAAVYTNRDYEPYAAMRDTAVSRMLEDKGIPMHTFKDHVVFEYGEVLKEDGRPYTVFTPYSRKWKQRLDSTATPGPDGRPVFGSLTDFPSETLLHHLWQQRPPAMPSLADIGFEATDIAFPPKTISSSRIGSYDKTRNFPAMEGTSRLGVHFRFGTISIRQKARKAHALNETFLNELIWRDFYSQILAHFPQVATQAFKPAYDRIPWRDAPADLERWKKGATGYPLVDAGMRELESTGFMHNRVRMLTASFLTKHLLIDWRLGEAHFAEKLLDYDLASNCGGWQWAAGCGTDAAPYFRIFNPAEQLRKFDARMEYVHRWVPEYGTTQYPPPMVDHAFARQRCLQTFKAALES